MSEKRKDRFDIYVKIDPGNIYLDRADLSRSRLRDGGREQPGVGMSATGHGSHLASRATGLTGT